MVRLVERDEDLVDRLGQLLGGFIAEGITDDDVGSLAPRLRQMGSHDLGEEVLLAFQ